MSPKFKRLSGADIVGILNRFGFGILSQKGSHIKLVRITKAGERQTLTVPNHKELDTGTVQAIYKQASRYINDDMLRQDFYSD